MEINTVIESFKQLVNDFTNHRDFSTQGNIIFKQKEKMLIDFAKNINSLIVCLKVLEQETDQSLLYFASQFVKDKLKYEFEQLNEQSIQGTHSQIAQIMSKRKDLTKIVTKNLAFALTYIYLHCYTSTYTILNFIKTTFYGEDKNASPTPIYYKYLFKFLDCIPCEIDNRKLVMDEIKRNEVDQNLKSQQVEILKVMHTLFEETYPHKDQFVADDFENMLYAFAEWLKISNPPTEVTSVLHNHNVLKLAFNSLSDSLLSEAATEALQAAIQSVSNIDESPEFYAFIGHNLFLLINNVKKQIEDQETDEAENFLKVICNYGSHACKSLVENLDANGKEFLEQMIEFTKEDSLNIFGQLTDFWENFMYFLINKTNKSTLTKEIADSIVGSLYQTYCYRIRYNTNQLRELNELSEKQLTKLHQSVEDIRERREIAREIFESIAKYLGPKVYVIEVMKTVTELYQKKEDESWHRIEASLYSLRDVMKLFPNCEDLQLFLLLTRELLQQTPYVIVRKSIVRALEPLFAMQEKNEEFVLFVLNLIVGLLDESLLSEKVNSAFERGCKENADILCRHIKEFSVLLEKYPQNESILLGIIQILKKNPDLLTETLPKIIDGPLQSLQFARNSKEKREIFTKLFAIIEAVPKGETKGISNIIELLLKNMFPIIKQILQAPEKTNEPDQDKLIERTVKFLKLVMRGIPDQFAHYLKEIFDIVLAAYPIYPINSYIYMFEVTFTVYYKSKNPEIIAYLQMLYIEFCRISYTHLNDPSSVNNLQNLADDFIGLNKRIITFHTRMFFESGQVEKILEFAVHCMGSGVLRPASSASQLLEIVFMIYWTPYSRQVYESEDKGEVVEIDSANNELYQTLKQYILPIIPTLLTKMFSLLETVPTETTRDNVLDCFEAIALAFPKESQIIWQQPLLELPEDILTNSEKERLKVHLLKLGSDNHNEFLNSEHVVGRLIYTISSRYAYRKSRGNLNVAR